MLNYAIIMYAAYSTFAASALAWIINNVAQRHTGADPTTSYMYTAAAVKLIDIIWGTVVPVRYMIHPPTVPKREQLLEKDKAGVCHSRCKQWNKREGAFSMKLPLQLFVIILFDWL
jgi:hypothetical protein